LEEKVNKKQELTKANNVNQKEEEKKEFEDNSFTFQGKFKMELPKRRKVKKKRRPFKHKFGL